VKEIRVNQHKEGWETAGINKWLTLSVG